jgi:hypothetical protein
MKYLLNGSASSALLKELLYIVNEDFFISAKSSCSYFSVLHKGQLCPTNFLLGWPGIVLIFSIFLTWPLKDLKHFERLSEKDSVSCLDNKIKSKTNKPCGFLASAGKGSWAGPHSHLESSAWPGPS